MSADCFEIQMGDLRDRLDVVYYQLRLEVDSCLPTGDPLSKYVTKVRTKSPARELYTEDGIPCIKLRNVTGSLLNVANCDRIPFRLKSGYTFAKRHDLIVTATGEGTAGRVDMFLESGEYIVTGESILLRPNAGLINPFYLLAVLRSGIVAKQLARYVRGATGQTHLYWNDIADIRIPPADDSLQDECERLFNQGDHLRRESDGLLMEFRRIGEKALNPSV